jgi:spore coat polysaccharide biosynthesis protein SpsF
MGSTRLPGKALEPILDRPLLLRLIDRLSGSETLDGIVVATTVRDDDDRLVDELKRAGITVRRGPIDDVLTRFLQVIDEFAPDTIVRLTGDNPLVDAATVDTVVRAHAASGADYTTNGLSGRYPYGLNVEVVQTSALRTLAALPLTQRDREHVTIGLLERPDRFVLASVTQQRDNSDLRWTVDLADDLVWAREVFASLHPINPRFGQQDVIDLIARRPELRRTMGDAP